MGHEKGGLSFLLWWVRFALSKTLVKGIDQLGIEVSTAFLQKTTLVGTARILTRFLRI